MAIYKIDKNKLLPIPSKLIDLERDIQRLTELNLELVFRLTFVSGSLNQEFSVKAIEQDFYIDTLAFDEEEKSITIIEYKKDKSISVIDQGFAYLSTMLNHKADFVLELNERLKKNFTKKDINWEASRIIFVSPEFTNYQRNAINFKDLPIFLYEVKLYRDGLIDYNPIVPVRMSASIKRLSSDTTIQKVSKEIKVYSVEDLVKPNWTNTKELLDEFEKQLFRSEYETKIKYTKFYIAYMSKHGRNYVEVVPQQQGLKIFFRFPATSVKSTLKIGDCSTIGRFANGISYVYLNDSSQIPEVAKLSHDSYQYLHKDIKKNVVI